MAESGANTGHTEARTMLDVFIRGGATGFDVTWTNAAGEKERFRRCVSPTELARTLPSMTPSAGSTAEEPDDPDADALMRAWLERAKWGHGPGG